MFSSPITAWLGVAIEVLTIANQIVKDNPIPQTKEEWFSLTFKVATGVAVFFAKDYNKSNAPNPETISKTVT